MSETLKSLGFAQPLIRVVWLAGLLVVCASAGADTPLHLAAFDGSVAEVKQLLDSGAAVDAKAVSGSTALMVAASRGHQPVVELLLARGARINQQNEFGWTALMMAINQRHKAVAQFLLARDADARPSDREGRAAFDFAVARGITDLQSEQVSWLVAKGEWLVSKRQLTTPAGNNALENFQRALSLEPANAKAKAGMQSIADVYMKLARSARDKGDVDKAESYAARGLNVVPDHTGLLKLAPQERQGSQVAGVSEADRVAAEKARLEQELQQEKLVAAQVAAEVTAKVAAQAKADEQQRQRQAAELLERAKKEAIAGDVASGIALAEQGLKLVPAHPGIAAWIAGAQKERDRQNELEKRIAALLVEAAGQRKAGKFVTPANDNAAATYQRVLELDGNETTALSGLKQLAADVSERARQLEAAGDIAGALTLTGSALALLDNDASLRTLDTGLRSRSSRLVVLLALAQEQLDRGDLGQPKGANAIQSYRAALKLAPGNTDAVNGLKLVADRYLQLATEQQRDGALRAAGATLGQALQHFANEPKLLALGREIEQKIARVNELLLLAGDQLAGGQLAGSNKGALASYRQALQIEPGNAKALEGLDAVANRYLRLVEERKNDLSAAFAIAEEGHSALPDNPKLALAHEQLQIRVKTVAALLKKADSAFISAPQGEPSFEAADAYQQVLALDPANLLAMAALKKLHTEYLDAASRHAQAGNLDKSLAVLHAGLAAFDDDAELVERERQTRSRLAATRVVDQQVAKARRLLAAGKTDEAMKVVETGLSEQPAHASLLTVRREIYAGLAERNGREVQVNALLAEAKSQWSKAKPATPAAESAILKYREVVELDPSNIDALRALNDIKNDYLEIVTAREKANDLDGAQRAVDAALVYFNSHPDLRAARERLTGLHSSAKANQVRISGMLVAARTQASKISASILDFQTEVRVLERAAQRELETKWQPSSTR